MEDSNAPRQLLSDADLDLVSDRERQAYYMLSDREYAHTREYSLELLKEIGMDVEFVLFGKLLVGRDFLW